MKEKNMENTQEFKTNDFYQAVILKTVGLPLLRLEKALGQRFFIFIFDDPDSQAQRTIEKYWNHQIKVDAREFVENINELKTRIHSGV